MRKMPEIKYRLKNGQELTEDQIKEVEASRDIPITFGDDSPEIDPVKTPQLFSAMMNAVGERNRRIANRNKNLI